jgi:hypothetical protein
LQEIDQILFLRLDPREEHLPVRCHLSLLLKQ